MTDRQQTLVAAMQRILRPLIKMLIRSGISYAAFIDMAKDLYFDVAKTEFAIPGKKQTASRISTLTGLSRKEVAKLEASPPRLGALDASRINRSARVISGWVRDKEFQAADGEPANLPLEGDAGSFSALVKRYSGDITPRTIADELAHTGAISVTLEGQVRLNTRAFISSSDDVEMLTLLGGDVADLINTIDHNINQPLHARLQRKVSYNYLPEASCPELNTALSEIAQRTLEAMDKVMAKYAIPKKSANKNQSYNRAGIGIYYFEDKQS